MNKHEYLGKTKEEAIHLAMAELNNTVDNMYIQEVEVKNSIFNKKVKIEVVEKQEVIDYVKKFLIDITKQMGIISNIEVKQREDTINFILYSDHNALLIGKNGKTLEALTTITRQMLLRELKQSFHFILDVEEYKLKKQNDIIRIAKRTAKEVASTKIEAKLDPMNSYERRLVHNALTNSNDVYTESVGEEPNRYVIIKPRKEE